jgi:hypothetical protein
LRIRGLSLLAAFLLVGCAVVAGPRDQDPFAPGLWPIGVGDRRPWAGVVERAWLGPLVHRESEVEGEAQLRERRFELRPLYSVRRSEELVRHDLFYPLARWRQRAEGTLGWLFYLGRTRYDPETDSREAVLGPVYRGRRGDGSRYGGLFPLFGTFEGLFGFDRVRFALWPLYARGHRGGYTETQILWPFFAYGRGDGRSKLRVWPFYGVKRREGVAVHRFFAWPLVHHHVTHLDTATPSRALYIMPLYGRRDGGPRHTRFYLFPLLAHKWDDTNLEAYGLDILWPVFSSERHVRGDTYWALRPIVEFRRGAERSGWSLGLGLLGKARVSGDAVEGETSRLLWASRFGWRREGNHETRFRAVWPLFRSFERTGPDGTGRGFLRVPYLLPLHGLEPDGWDRHYNKLFELYGARRLGEERRSSLLFGLRETRDSASESWVSWAGFFHRSR